MKFSCAGCNQKLEYAETINKTMFIDCPVCSFSIELNPLPVLKKTVLKPLLSSDRSKPRSDVNPKVIDDSQKLNFTMINSMKMPLTILILIVLAFFSTLVVLAFNIGRSSAIFPVQSQLNSNQVVQPIDMDAMIYVLKEDKRVADSYRGKPKLKTNADYDLNAKNMLNMVRDMKRIDSFKCPPDFIKAYNNHVNAWADFQYEYSQHPYMYTQQELQTRVLWDGVSGNNPVPSLEAHLSKVKSWNAKANRAYLEISPTYLRVERIAEKYGIDESSWSNE